MSKQSCREKEWESAQEMEIAVSKAHVMLEFRVRDPIRRLRAPHRVRLDFEPLGLTTFATRLSGY